jgi:hypothetical protein
MRGHAHVVQSSDESLRQRRILDELPLGVLKKRFAAASFEGRCRKLYFEIGLVLILIPI